MIYFFTEIVTEIPSEIISSINFERRFRPPPLTGDFSPIRGGGLGLSPFSCTAAHLEAGTIRATEYISTPRDSRPDGSEFYSVIRECNLNYNPGVTPNQVFITALPDAEAVYNHLVKNYSGNDKMYSLLMSSEYTTICVGSVKKPGNTDNYQWVIIAN